MKVKRPVVLLRGQQAGEGTGKKARWHLFTAVRPLGAMCHSICAQVRAHAGHTSQVGLYTHTNKHMHIDTHVHIKLAPSSNPVSDEDLS